MQDKLNYSTSIFHDLTQISNSQPLIHNITNYVAMPFIANALLAIGASPIMAHAIDEIEEIIQMAKALVINIGTLDNYWLQSMLLAMETAKTIGIPIILDPVGAGATHFRTEATLKLINKNPPQVIRGNAAEILALGGHLLTYSKGVDSLYQSEQACEAAKELAKQYGCTIVISGKEDFIINPTMYYKIANGIPLMTKITGMGCTATAIIGAFCSINSDITLASTYAMAVMGIAGEIAAKQAVGPATLQMHFIDTLYNLKEIQIREYLQLTQG
ncbi:MAG: Hydroxyethylthiazole kinase [Legionellaceae bacterium]